jgi:hypothetical protein
MKMSLEELVMDKIRFVYRDTVTGSDMDVWIGHSLAKIDGIDLDHLRFGVPRFEASGLRARISQRQSLGGAPAAGVDMDFYWAGWWRMCSGSTWIKRLFK